MAAATGVRSGLAVVLLLTVSTVSTTALAARLETLRWTQSDQPVAVAGFRVYVESSSNTDISPLPDFPANAILYANGVYSLTIDFDDYSGLQSVESETLSFSLRSYSAAGVESCSSNSQTRTPPPASPANSAPVSSIDAPGGSALEIRAGESINFDGSATDADGDNLTFYWDFDGAGQSNQAFPRDITFNNAGSYEVSLVVTDTDGAASAPATVTVSVSWLGDSGGEPGGSGAEVDSMRVFQVGGGLVGAHYLTAPAGDPRLFVVERHGTIRIIEGGGLRTTPFLDLRSDTSCDVDGGLLGLAFDPDYSDNGYFFVSRTNAAGDNVISRFTVSANAYLADSSTEVIILSVDQPYSGNNGGQILFGPDDYLYIGIGDGGGSFDPDDRAQDDSSLLGKILRIDVAEGNPSDSVPVSGQNYRIPTSNPLYGDSDSASRDEIWAMGLRNPIHFSFDRELEDLWIADPGEGYEEEFNFELASNTTLRNYGWPFKEGDGCLGTESECDSSELVDPEHVYIQSGAATCDVIGGFVYRGSQDALQGEYYFADGCSGKVWSYAPDEEVLGKGVRANRTQSLSEDLSQTLSIVGFGEGGFGNLYLINEGTGIYKVRGTDPECSDGMDNDGDGLFDYPEDPGCRTADSLIENPLCNDQFDNDGDLQIDLLDPDCSDAWGNLEEANSDNKSLCGLGYDLIFSLPMLMWARKRMRKNRKS